MQSKIKGAPEVHKSEYPCLKIFDEVGSEDFHKVVLFTSQGTGTTVHAIGNLSALGDHCRCWSEADFRDFNGTIELSN